MSVANDKKSITLNNNYSSDVIPKVGDTIVLLNNTQGTPYIATRTITSISSGTVGNGTQISWSEAVDFEIHSATIHCGNMNVVTTATKARDFDTFKSSATDVSSSAGLSADIDVTTDGKPVVAYYDAANSTLKVVAASSEEPDTAAEWTRYDTGKSCSGEVSIEVDGANGIHIMYKNTNGELCYIYGATADALDDATEEVIDTNGTLAYGSLSVIAKGSVYTPCVTYLNIANTANGVKYAYRTTAGWDNMIVPSEGSGHYAIAENTISLEGRKSGWTSTTETVLTNGGTTATPATVDAVLAFKSKQFETAYLKTE